jgi:hypothetical protein
MGWQQREG